ncbi:MULTISPECIES: MBL fold metallo-hydrolase [unclassified Fusibacter]|uniref:MBL fold metallo-hydrolase n=1 Tax=unclassified Fusibacter TaxID=2624464 RepID=UPI001011F582|nr:MULTISPECIES: MBL fold metallo-hydrolase [unclassified Fusibacter]MCK8057999.1 MBL fold metallo-hydrolase [Fusibacter sp. A2]NPE20581.1 MBL fold metallo-hydrolase [Fusibacter sp. A1]RXV62788.1 MBL fold metallo-hydrolase [Fusibacter sp. A1]
MIRINLWGVMGSIPGASSEMVDFGSNTSCISVVDDQTVIILDAGSGIIHSHEVTKNATEIHLFITHYHMDHLIGLPLWDQLYDQTKRIHIHGPLLNGFDVETAVRGFIHAPYFPITLDKIQASIEFHTVKERTTLDIGNFTVEGLLVGHPGGNMAYKIKNKEMTFGYITDIDLDHADSIQVVGFFDGMKLAYLDTHFTNMEYVREKYKGWGHSSMESGVLFRDKASIGTLLLGHHAPHRTVRTLMQFIERYQDEEVMFAKEGMRFEFNE